MTGSSPTKKPVRKPKKYSGFVKPMTLTNNGLSGTIEIVQGADGAPIVLDPGKTSPPLETSGKMLIIIIRG
jgi:hypothetical protein